MRCLQRPGRPFSVLPIKGIPGKKKELNELDMMEIVEVRVKLPERRAQALELPVKRG